MWQSAWDILCDSAIYVLVGFSVAGVLHVLMAGGRAIHWLSERSSRSVFLATMVGVPLPLCSCSVLPAAVTLRKKGASKGATLSFLISTPETSVTSIMLTYSLLGPLLAVFRPIAATVTALVAGLIDNFVEKHLPTPASGEEGPAPASSCCGPTCGCESAAESLSEPATDVRPTFRQGFRYAFIDLFDDIFIWIVIGIVAAALIKAALPAMVFQEIFTGAFTSMLLMLIVGIPLYVCAESSTPIAAMLMLKGLNPGAALVLLLAGPATNIGSVGVLYRLLGRRTVVIYLITIAVVSLCMGALLNGLLAFGRDWIPLEMRVLDEPLAPGWLKTTGAVLFLVRGLFTIHRKRYFPRFVAWMDQRLPISVTPRGFLLVVGLVAILGYAGSGLHAIQPGEVGIVKRFGAVTRSDLRPGLHYLWPSPIETVDRVAVRRVYRTVLGFSREAVPESDSDPVESWTLIGDENIADIKTSVNWGAIDDRILRFQYATADRERLVRDVTLGVIREVLGEKSINTAFTTDRYDCQQRIETLIRARLAACDAGIRVDSFQFLDAHAPPEVHDAFRDVASALEDKSTQINLALTQEARIVPVARGDAERIRAAAEGYAAATVAQSRGEAQRYVDLLAEYQGWPQVTRQRMYFETLDEILPKVRKYIKTTRVGEIEIWLVNPRVGESLPFQPDAELR